MRALQLAFVLAVAAPLAAQQATRPDFVWEKNLPADRVVSLHNLNGDITVTPSSNANLSITGTIRRGRGRNSTDTADVTIEVVESSRGITACSMFRHADMECYDGGMEMHNNRRRGWRDRDDYYEPQIDMEVRLPKGMRLEANSVSGDVRVSAAEGAVRAGSVSGNVRMERLRATSVRATSVSGDVDVIVDQLAGDGPLTFSSVSGNVTAELPKDLDADISIRSVSGSMDTDFPLTLSGRVSRNSINARIGKGGRELEVHTVSGDVRLRTLRQ